MSSATATLMSSIYCEYLQNNATNFFNRTSNSTSSNTTSVPNCLGSTLKPTQPPIDYAKIVARFFYIIVLLIGTIGNLLACYIIITRKFMRRVIHIYTFNLAVADLIVILFYVPVEIVRNENDLKWTMGQTMCSLNNFLTPTSLVASICTLVAITLDRHRGVTKPFLWRGDSRKVLKITLPAIWIFAVALSLPLVFFAELVPHEGSLYCIESFDSKTAMKVYWIVMFVLQVVLPLGIIIAANSHMIWAMARLSHQMVQDENNRQHKRMIRMVVTLVLVYAICSSPQHIVFFWFAFGDLEQRRELSMYLFKASNLLMIVQSTVNPIIYGTGRNDFKRALKAIFRCTKHGDYQPTTKGEQSSSPLSGSETEAPPCSSFGTNANRIDLNPGKMKGARKASKYHKYNTTDTPPINRKELVDRLRQKAEKGKKESVTRMKPRYLRMQNVEGQGSDSMLHANGRVQHDDDRPRFISEGDDVGFVDLDKFAQLLRTLPETMV